MASTTALTYIFVLISGPGVAMSFKGFLKACSNMSSCVYLQRGQRSHRPCGRFWWNIFSRFIGHYRYATLKCMCHSYTFMVAVNLPIKPSSILAAGETAKLLTGATAWRRLRCFPHLSAAWQTATNCKSVTSEARPTLSLLRANKLMCVWVCIHPAHRSPPLSVSCGADFAIRRVNCSQILG